MIHQEHHWTLQQLSGHLFSVTGHISTSGQNLKQFHLLLYLKNWLKEVLFLLYHTVHVSTVCRSRAQTPHLSNHSSVFSPTCCFYVVQLLMGRHGPQCPITGIAQTTANALSEKGSIRGCCHHSKCKYAS